MEYFTKKKLGEKNKAICLTKSKNAIAKEKQKSVDMKITTDRSNLLNNKTHEQTSFTIEDLNDDGGNAAGTRIFLKIFYKDISEA